MATFAQFKSFGPLFSGGVLCTIRVYHYITGTTTLKDGWTDRGKSSTVAQPLVSDSEGIASAWWDGLYKFRIDVSTDGVNYSTLYTYDAVAVVDQSESLAGEGTAIASASTLTLGTDGNIFHVTGNTGPITAISGNQNTVTLVFDSTPTLTHSGNLILQDSKDVVAAANDVMVFFNEGSSVWREVSRTSPFTISDARTTTVAVPLTLTAVTSGTPDVGIGTGILLRAESADENPSNVGQIEFAFSDKGAGTEDSYMQALLRVAGAALTACWRWAATGAFKGIFTHANAADRTYTFPDATGNIPTVASQAEVNAMTSTTTGLSPNHNKLVMGTYSAIGAVTSVTIGSIPAGVRRITLSFVGMSTNSTGDIILQIGDADGIETSGYLGAGTAFANATSPGVANATAHFLIDINGAAGSIRHGAATLTLADSATFTWVFTSVSARSDSTGSAIGAGSKSLSAELTQIKFSASGDTFDAGSYNVTYER